MRAHIYLRRTLDWSRVTWEQFLASQNETDALFLKDKVSAWNDIFGVKYFEFRAELKKIAQDNLKAIFNLSIVSDLSEISEDDLLVPVDDDDWFAPDVIDEVSRAGSSMLYWNQSWGSNNIIFTQNTHLIDLDRNCTNNYALAKGLSSYQTLECHWEAAKLFRERPHIKLDRWMSFAVKTPASWGRMHTWSNPEEARSQMAYTINDWKDFPMPLPWVRPYMERLSSLASEAMRKVRFFL